MSLLDETRAAKLILLARERFDPGLQEAELRVLRDSASSLELTHPDKDAPRPEVRATFLRWLATDVEAKKLIDARGLRVYAATITGRLDLDECRGMPTLNFRRCEFPERIVLRSAGTSGLFLWDCAAPQGMSADRSAVAGPVFLRRSHFNAEIRLMGAEIKGDLDCSSAKLTAAGDALSLDGARIGGDVFLRGGFECSGEIRLLGAEVKGDLDCGGAKLTAAGDALSLDRANIGGDVYLRDGFECAGEIRLLGAEVKGRLACSGAKLTAAGDALSLDGARIGGDVFLSGGFECSGEIRLLGAEVKGNLDFMGAQVASVRCLNLRLGDDLIWQGIKKLPETELQLIGSRVRNLRDDRLSWPAQDKLNLDGLVYEELTLHKPPTQRQIDNRGYGSELDLNAGERVDWLKLQPSEVRLEPQPWMQLAKHLETKGDKAGAKHVLYEFRCLQAGKSWLLWRRVRIAFAWLEESPARILWPIALTLLFGTIVFAGASCSGSMVPTNKDRFDSGEGVAKLEMLRYPPFNAFVYTLENTVPLVKLGMDDKWAPDWLPNPAPDCKGWCWLCKPLRAVPALHSYWFLASARWLLIFAGWFQAAVLGAAITSRFKA